MSVTLLKGWKVNLGGGWTSFCGSCNLVLFLLFRSIVVIEWPFTRQVTCFWLHGCLYYSSRACKYLVKRISVLLIQTWRAYSLSSVVDFVFGQSFLRLTFLISLLSAAIIAGQLLATTHLATKLCGLFTPCLWKSKQWCVEWSGPPYLVFYDRGGRARRYAKITEIYSSRARQVFYHMSFQFSILRIRKSIWISVFQITSNSTYY